MLVAFATIGFASSCSKCSHCVNSGVSGASYCTKDSQTLYDAAKTACTASGGTWEND